MSMLPPMPSDWSFAPGRVHYPLAIGSALGLIAMMRNAIANGERTSSTSWRLYGTSVRIRWARHGDRGTIPILELRDHTRDGGNSVDPTLEVSLPWSNHPDLGGFGAAGHEVLALEIMDMALAAIEAIGSGGPSAAEQAADVFDALHGLLGQDAAEAGGATGTFVLWLPTPWSDVQCRRCDVDGNRRLTDEAKDRAIAAASPRVVECDVTLLDQGRRTAVTLSGCTWVGRRHVDPVSSMRAIASMPALAEAFR